MPSGMAKIILTCITHVGTAYSRRLVAATATGVSQFFTGGLIFTAEIRRGRIREPPVGIVRAKPRAACKRSKPTKLGDEEAAGTSTILIPHARPI